MFVSEDNENEPKIDFAKLLGGKLLARETSLSPVLTISFPMIFYIWDTSYCEK